MIISILISRTFTSTDDDDDYDDEHDIENESPSDKYKKPKEYSFAGLILSRLIRESCKWLNTQVFIDYSCYRRIGLLGKSNQPYFQLHQPNQITKFYLINNLSNIHLNVIVADSLIITPKIYQR